MGKLNSIQLSYPRWTIALSHYQVKIMLSFALLGVDLGTLYLIVTLWECFTIANIIHQRRKKLLPMPSKQASSINHINCYSVIILNVSSQII